MAEAGPPGGGDSLGEVPPAALVAALRDQGADAVDPVGFRFIAALAERAEAQEGEARRLLEARLNLALADYNARLQRARQEPAAPVAEAAPSPLTELLAHLGKDDWSLPASPATASPALPAASAAPAPVELKALRLFRDTWSQLSAEQQLADSLAQAPENAGPLNSHHLVLRAFERMREVSPDYLKHFLSYAETLLWLEQANPVAAPAAKAAPKTAAKGEGEKKRRPGKGNAA